jgi:hypothetical protein
VQKVHQLRLVCDNDVVLLERHDWRNASGGAVYLSGAHTAPVEHLAFSPNGASTARGCWGGGLGGRGPRGVRKGGRRGGAA